MNKIKILTLLILTCMANQSYSEELVSAVTSMNPKDVLISFERKDIGDFYQYMNHREEGNFAPQLSVDIDNDGYMESIIFLVSTTYDELYMMASKFNQEGDGVTDYLNWKMNPEQWGGDAIFTLLLHDFDSDGKNELVMAIDTGGDISGKVFNLNGSGINPKTGKNLRNWFEPVGDFDALVFAPVVDGMFILTNHTQVGGKNEKSHLYLDGKLKEIK